MLFPPKFCSAGILLLLGRSERESKLPTVTELGSGRFRNGSEFSQISKIWHLPHYHATSRMCTAQKSPENTPPSIIVDIYWAVTRCPVSFHAGSHLSLMSAPWSKNRYHPWRGKVRLRELKPHAWGHAAMKSPHTLLLPCHPSLSCPLITSSWKKGNQFLYPKFFILIL